MLVFFYGFNTRKLEIVGTFQTCYTTELSCLYLVIDCSDRSLSGNKENGVPVQ